MPFVPAVAVFLGLMTLTAGLVWLAQPARGSLYDRLKRFDAHMPDWKKLTRAEQQRLRNAPFAGSVTKMVERAVGSRGIAQQVALSLAQANLKLTVSEYLVISLLIALFTMAITTMISGTPVVGLIFGLVSLYLPPWYVKSRERRRVDAFNAQLAETTMLMSSSLKSGYGLVQGMEMVAKEQQPPISEEFGRVVREVGLGLSLDRAMDNLARRINSNDLHLMITAIKVQHEMGGDLTKILDTIAETIRERVRIKGEIRILTAQQTMAAYIIAGMPLGLAGILMLLDPTYLLGMFAPGWYIAMPICAGLGIVLGFLVMRRIVAIEV